MLDLKGCGALYSPCSKDRIHSVTRVALCSGSGTYKKKLYGLTIPLFETGRLSSYLNDLEQPLSRLGDKLDQKTFGFSVISQYPQRLAGRSTFAFSKRTVGRDPPMPSTAKNHNVTNANIVGRRHCRPSRSILRKQAVYPSPLPDWQAINWNSQVHG